MNASNAVIGTARADGAAAATAIAVARVVAATAIVAMAIAAALNRPRLARQSWRGRKTAQSSDNHAARVRAAAAKFNVTVAAAMALKAAIADAANGTVIAAKVIAAAAN